MSSGGSLKGKREDLMISRAHILVTESAKVHALIGSDWSNKSSIK